MICNHPLTLRDARTNRVLLHTTCPHPSRAPHTHYVTREDMLIARDTASGYPYGMNDLPYACWDMDYGDGGLQWRATLTPLARVFYSGSLSEWEVGARVSVESWIQPYTWEKYA